ncbi:recombination protein NinG [Utexia brackfieldae]|uniref:recombination protein NinG n=1 Tax=Utexia brackfieldae TaxID=3074108 RepID=UPI00370D4D12
MIKPLKPPKPKKCKNPDCGKSFVPAKFGQVVCCWQCAIAYNNLPTNKTKERVSREINKLAKDKVKTRSEHLAEAQKEFNAYIRLRDAKKPCISCGRHHQGQYHAGHYKTVGAHPELRFNELNVHKQCSACNNHKSGNIVEYRINLVKKVGTEAVEWLEGNHEAKKYTIEEIKQIKTDYRQKIKDIKRKSE